MKKVLLLAMIVVIAASVPASAAYKCNWYGLFEQPKYTIAPLTGQDGWFLAANESYTTEKTMDVVDSAAHTALVGPQGVRSQIVAENGPYSANARSMTDLNANGKTYFKGYAKFWVYDPGFTGSVGGADGRVGVYGANGENNIGKMATAQIQDASTRDPNFWYAQWSYSVGKMDGATAVATGSDVSGTWSFTQGLAAPRKWGQWSYAMLSWAFTYNIPGQPSSGGTGVMKWFINQQSVSPNLTLNMTMNANPTTGRYFNFRDIKGIFMGSGVTTVSNGRPVAYDNAEFHADPLPEPSSLLALGTGLVGLMGLIRRRK